MDRALLADLAPHLDRRVRLTLSVADRELYVDVGGRNLHGAVERHALVL